MSSTYDVIIDTPKYHRQGKMKLELKGGTAQAHLEIFEAGTIEAQGTRNDKEFDVSGTTDLGGEGAIEFTAHGSIWANSVNIKAETGLGEVVIYGTQTGYSAGDFSGNDKGFAGRWADAC